MKNLGQMMKQAQEMQAKMQEMQARLEAAEVIGHSRRRHGHGHAQRQGRDAADQDRSEDRRSASEVEVLEDLILAAVNDARAKVDSHVEEEMAKVTGGLQLPAGMKLPF